MKNKTKLLPVLVIAMMSLSILSFASAESNVNANANLETSANVNVSEIDASLDEDVSGFKIFMKEIGLLFTVNQEMKAKKELDIARLRLIQAKVAAKNNNTVAVARALDAHAKIIARVQARIEKIDEGSRSEKESRASAKMFVGIERAIEVHELHAARMRVKLQNENLTVEQKARIEASIAKVEANIDHLKQVREAKEAKIKTRLMATANLSEDESEDLFAEIEASESLDDLKKLKIKIKEERKAKIKSETKLDSDDDDDKDEDSDDKDDEDDDDNEVESETEVEVETELKL